MTRKLTRKWYSLIGGCVPYSQQACEYAANRHGLRKGGKGYEFASIDFSTKGCYGYKSGSYAGIAFYGIGGLMNEMKAPFTSDDADGPYRLSGDDCEMGTIYG